jgi:hypothetical protein
VVRILVVPAALVLMVACAHGPQHSLGAVDAFVADEAGRLERVVALALPREAEIAVHPRWFAGQLSPPGSPAPRLQAYLRAVREDGGVTQWALAGDSEGREDASVGLGDASQNGRYRQALAATQAPLVRARDLAALEVLIAALPARGSSPDGAPPLIAWSGAAALAQAPPARCVDGPTLSRAERVAREAGGRLELAVRLPLLLVPAPPDATDFSVLLVLVEADPWPSRPVGFHDRLRLDSVQRLSGPDGVPTYPATTSQGLAVAHTSAIVLELRVQVPKDPAPLPPDRPEPPRPPQPGEEPPPQLGLARHWVL